MNEVANGSMGGAIEPSAGYSSSRRHPSLVSIQILDHLPTLVRLAVLIERKKGTRLGAFLVCSRPRHPGTGGRI